MEDFENKEKSGKLYIKRRTQNILGQDSEVLTQVKTLHDSTNQRLSEIRESIIEEAEYRAEADNEIICLWMYILRLLKEKYDLDEKGMQFIYAQFYEEHAFEFENNTAKIFVREMEELEKEYLQKKVKK